MKQILLLVSILFSLFVRAQVVNTDVWIIGGGASGTMAAIQAARMGVSVVVTEETPWLGGMLTSAGVSAIDGNYRLHSGLWEEFRQKLNNHYGGEENLKTGWVSNVLFEPHVAAGLLSEMVETEKKLSIFRETILQKIEKSDNGWIGTALCKSKPLTIRAGIVIDATELGDVAKMVGIPYDIGMDSRMDTGEEIAPKKANDIIQDLTYVAVLKDFGEGTDRTISRPTGYSAAEFYCTCAGKCDPDSMNRTLWDCNKMLEYGKLPNGYYMINWPIYGNDYYTNVIELSSEQRKIELDKAKTHTLRYIYYMQTELGFKNLGIADDVYPTIDGLPFIPYHRESRRIKGLVRFTINDLARPYEQKNPLYRTGIAVGDYPVDHHHAAYPEAHKLPDLHFYPVPSYTLPLGTLIPENTDNFIVAEKSISVTNLVNGTTRLQPVCMLIGQASGILAALSVKNGLSPREVSVRKVQAELLKSGAFIMPYSDVDKNRPSFQAIQRIGASGILKGEGINIGWENHTLFHPDSLLKSDALKLGLEAWLTKDSLNFKKEYVSFSEALECIHALGKIYKLNAGEWSYSELHFNVGEFLKKVQLNKPSEESPVTREVFAVLLDEFIDPFRIREVDHNGQFLTGGSD